MACIFVYNVIRLSLWLCIMATIQLQIQCYNIKLLWKIKLMQGTVSWSITQNASNDVVLILLYYVHIELITH